MGGLNRLRLLLTAVTLLTTAGLYGSVDNHAFKRLSVEHGLSQSTVLAGMQDSSGFIWIGTNDGLNRYDGRSFEIFKRSEDGAGLKDNWITALLEARDGRIWIGTYGPHLSIFDPRTGTFEHADLSFVTQSGYSQNIITCLVEMPGGEIWAGTQDGIVIADPQTLMGRMLHFGNEGEADDRARSSVTDMLVGRDGMVWIGLSGGGVVRFGREQMSFRFFREQSEENPNFQLTSNAVTALTLDADGNIWVGTDGAGINRITADGSRVLRYPPTPGGLEAVTINDMLMADDGRLWIAGDEGGLQIYSDGLVMRERGNSLDPLGLGDDQILNLWKDQSGLVWVGTYGAGAHVLKPILPGFRNYRTTPGTGNSISEGMITSFARDDSGRLWVGTHAKGLDIIHMDETIENKQHQPNVSGSLSHNFVKHIYNDRRGVIWVAGMRGLNRYLPADDRFRLYQHDPDDPRSISNDLVQYVFEDSQERFWVATYGGLNVMDRERGRFSQLMHSGSNPQSISSDQINVVVEDAEGVLWIGTELGLNRMAEMGVFEPFEHMPDDPNSLPHNSVMAVLPDDQGGVWVGTYGGGLAHLNQEGAFQSFGVAQGLANDSVYCILRDDFGDLWISTNAGISRFNPQTAEFTNYSTDNGLIYNEFNRNAGFMDLGGDMFFGTRGFVRVSPERVGVVASSPPVVLSAIRKFGRLFDPGVPYSSVQQLNLANADALVTFNFTVLDFADPARNRLSYKMDGFADEWINLEPGETSISFTNLSPGDYTLQVRGGGALGNWSEETANVAIFVPKPWYFSITAFVAYGVLLLLTMFIAFRIRKASREQAVARAISMGRAEFATTVLHNIGNVLNSLRVSADQGERLLRSSRTGSLSRAANMLYDNRQKENYLSEDDRGKLLPEYLKTASEVLLDEQKEFQNELDEMSRKIDLMKDIIETQQANAKLSLIDERHDLHAILEDAIKVTEEVFMRRHIEVDRRFGQIPEVKLQKSQAMHIVINLLKNAAEAMEAVMDRDRVLTIDTFEAGPTVKLKITDTGVGIQRADLKNMFTYGFTTKETGHGFGLHYCRRAMKEMGGTIEVDSDGLNEGATFTLTFAAVMG